tara:strand:+ start:785 stop:934 length:150 start_codon:yes stop_codon:yes gene_type:complete
MKKTIKILLIPFALLAFIVGLIRFIIEMTWDISSDFKKKIILYLSNNLN